MRICLLILLTTVSALSFPGKKSNKGGYDRFDFQVAGKKAYVVVPKVAASGKPWVWRARFPTYHAKVDQVLLGKGFHIAYIDVSGLFGAPKAVAVWDQFYKEMRKQGLASKVALKAVSRGGLIAYNWAKKNPEKVACIFAEVPVCDIKSWPGGKGKGIGSATDWKQAQKAYGKTEAQLLVWKGNPIDDLGALAKAKVPVMHVVGVQDKVVPHDENTDVLMKNYIQAGGVMTVRANTKKPEKAHGHHFNLEAPGEIVAFIEHHCLQGPDSKEYFSIRSSMKNSRLVFERRKKGRVAFLGGSITYNPGWRPMVCAHLSKRFKGTKFDFVHAGIPSFGSTPHAYRFSRDVLKKGPVDLLFIEAAVNDSSNGRTDKEQQLAVEGIIRQARASNPNMDIIIMHFVDPSKIADYNKGWTPKVIQNHEKVASHYKITSLDLALEVTERIAAKEFTWAKDFRNLHPSAFGQKLYAASMIKMLSTCWPGKSAEDDKITAHAPSAKLSKSCYDQGYFVPLSKAKLAKGWKITPKWRPKKGGARAGFVNVPMLENTGIGEVLTFPFTGTAVGLFVAAGYDAGTIEYAIDGGPWQKRDLYTRWSAGLHLPWLNVLAAGLPKGQHTLKIRVIKQKNTRSKGNACRIACFAVNGPKK